MAILASRSRGWLRPMLRMLTASRRSWLCFARLSRLRLPVPPRRRRRPSCARGCRSVRGGPWVRSGFSHWRLRCLQVSLQCHRRRKATGRSTRAVAVSARCSGDRDARSGAGKRGARREGARPVVASWPGRRCVSEIMRRGLRAGAKTASKKASRAHCLPIRVLRGVRSTGGRQPGPPTRARAVLARPPRRLQAVAPTAVDVNDALVALATQSLLQAASSCRALRSDAGLRLRPEAQARRATQHAGLKLAASRRASGSSPSPGSGRLRVRGSCFRAARGAANLRRRYGVRHPGQVSPERSNGEQVPRMSLPRPAWPSAHVPAPRSGGAIMVARLCRRPRPCTQASPRGNSRVAAQATYEGVNAAATPPRQSSPAVRPALLPARPSALAGASVALARSARRRT